MTERRWRLSLGAALGVLVLASYVETMAGSVSFWDCGEFIATAHSLGIPHPPATPLYVVLGRVFSLLPLPATVAQKINLMSALFGALGIVVLFLVVVRLIRDHLGDPKTWVDRCVMYGSGAVAALFTAWSNTYWTNAIEAEVYSISTFVMGVTTLLAMRWSQAPEKPESTRSIYLIIYLLSLGVGFHLGTALTYPAIALYVLLFRHKSFKDFDFVVFSFGFFVFLFHVNLKFGGVLATLALLLFLAALVWRGLRGKSFAAVSTGLFVLGVTIHLFLLIRSAQNPAIDEADPENWSNLMKVLRREQYPPSSLFVRKASWHFQFVEHFWAYFTEQYELVKGHTAVASRLALLPIVVGLFGIVAMALRAFRSWVLVFGTFLVTSLGMVVFLNFSDSEVRARDYFYSPAFYLYGIFIGVGLAAVLNMFFSGRQAVRSPAAGGGFAVAVRDLFSGERGVRSLVDRVGVVLGIGVFLGLAGMLHQAHHFEHDRTCERVPWGYGHNMLAGLENGAIIFTNGDNDTFPLWYQQEVEAFRADVRVVNLSLLNTTWYPRQLRDNEPRVALEWTDQDIDNLPNVSRQIYIQSSGKQELQPRDLAVRQIIRYNLDHKPIYFAVTIPLEVLAAYEDHLVLEGVVYRFQREQGTDMRNHERIAHNVDEVYDYAGILDAQGKHDDSVYRDHNQVSLVQNYAFAFLRLGQHQEELASTAASVGEQRVLRSEAIRRYEKAFELAPDFGSLSMLLVGAYQANDMHAQAIAHLEERMRRDPENDRYRFELSRSYLQAAAAGYDTGVNFARGAELLREVGRRNPEDAEMQQYVMHVLLALGMTAEAEEALRAWEARHPSDTLQRQFFEASQSGLIEPPADLAPPDRAPSPGRPDSGGSQPGS